MKKKNQTFLLFLLGKGRLALPLSVVDRVVFAPEIQPLPQGKEHFIGIFQYQGRGMVVLDLRGLFGGHKDRIELEDLFVILAPPYEKIALWVDGTKGFWEVEEGEVESLQPFLQGAPFLKEVMKESEGLAFIPDLDRFLEKLDLYLEMESK